MYQNSNSVSKKNFPFLLDIQADLLNHLTTRIVVPLMGSNRIKHPIKHLMPHFSVEGVSVTLVTSELTAVHKKILGNKVCSLEKYRNEIIAAIDFLLTGI